MHILGYIFNFLQFVVAVALVVIVTSQTTKSEGLAGTLGGKTTSSFQGRPGMDEQIQQYTTYLAYAFLVLSFISSFFNLRLGQF